MYHFIWIPKYRHKIFEEPYRSGLKTIIEIVELEVPVDHIHMVVRSEPKLPPSRIMQIIKSISSREFFRLYPDIKKRRFFGGGEALDSKLFC